MSQKTVEWRRKFLQRGRKWDGLFPERNVSSRGLRTVKEVNSETGEVKFLSGMAGHGSCSRPMGLEKSEAVKKRVAQTLNK